ncbi:MAG: malonyl-CoA decarboxylase domain-containing protein [Alphaproteobacteria bacterium]
MSQLTNPTILDRTWASLRQALREITPGRRGIEAIETRPDLPEADQTAVREHMRACLEGRGGEVTARARATALGRAYLSLEAAGRLRFLKMLAEEFDVDRAAVDAAAAELVAATDAADRARAERRLRAALDAPRIRLLMQFNALPDGVKFLVDMRAELLRLSRDEPVLRGLEGDLKRVLAGWFDVGFLELRRITWRSPALLLEKLIAYEAVHEIRGWTDLKNRLDSDRRCYAFFHPRMPDEPLIFVEVALVSGMADNVHVLLDEESPVADPDAADTAIFYSISNAQQGLAGISFGNFLIKRVVDDLSHEFKNLKTFATLSPIPGFRRWLDRRLAAHGDTVLVEAERKALAGLPLPDEADETKPASRLARLLATPGWHEDGALVAAARQPLLRQCAIYLAKEKRSDGRALDPVAHFHLSNGARMERLNWLGDVSKKGVDQAAGLMINYLYKLDQIDANHEAYTGEGRIVVSSAVKSLAK